jgi:phospholipase/lecithinase/hemolysin
MSLINASSLGIPSSLSFLGGSLSGLGRLIPQVPELRISEPTPPFSVIYAFGDSLSDAGNDYIATGQQLPVSPPYFKGHFTNGLTWVEDLALAEGLGPLTPSLLPGGTDFAYGGAETGVTPLHAAGPTDLSSQLMQFEAANPVPQPNALYTLSIGSADLFDAISALPSTPFEALSGISTAVANVDNFILRLAAHGAKNFLVLSVPDIGKAPAYESQGPVVSHTASALSAVFDAALTTSLQAIAATDHLNLDIVDTYSLVDQAVAHPALFGFTNVTDPVWTGNYTDPNSGILRATTPAAQSQYLFWDQVHPTAAGHTILAEVAETSLLHVA